MDSWNRVWSGFALMVTVAALVGGMASADVPKKINYQGRLTDSTTGAPLAGAHSMTFRLCSQSAGGPVLWSEDMPTTADSAGVVAVILGEIDPIEVSFAGPLWLEVQVDGEILAPRRELVTVPYAFNAMQVNGIDASATPVPGRLYPLDSSGKVPLAVLPDEMTPAAHAATHNAGGSDAVSVTSAIIQNGTILGEDVSDNSIPAAKIQPNIVGSVEGVSNDGGDIDLVPGSNISILANDAANTITISATGLATGDITAVSAGTGLDGGGVSGDVTLQIEVPLVLSASVASGGVLTGSNSSTGSGVYGFHTTTGNSGYLGTSSAGVLGTGSARGVEGYSSAGVGVRGASDHNPGVLGYSADSIGVEGYTPNGQMGVRGESGKESGIGVYGVAVADSFCVGVLGQSIPGFGVIGSSSQVEGIQGVTYGAYRAGIQGAGANIGSVGIEGRSLYGVGVFGTDWGPDPDNSYALWSKGDTRVTDDLYVDDGLQVSGYAIFAGGKSGYVVDVAQNDGNIPLEAGDIVVVSGSGPAVVGEIPLIKVRRAEVAETRAVIGVVDQRYESTPRSAASRDGTDVKVDTKLDDSAVLPGDYLTVVTLGSFKAIKVDASYGAIGPGDPLVASPNPGYAMRSESPKPGTIVGKALDRLESGTGTIPVVVTLQ